MIDRLMIKSTMATYSHGVYSWEVAGTSPSGEPVYEKTLREQAVSVPEGVTPAYVVDRLAGTVSVTVDGVTRTLSIPPEVYDQRTSEYVTAVCVVCPQAFVPQVAAVLKSKEVTPVTERTMVNGRCVDREGNVYTMVIFRGTKAFTDTLAAGKVVPSVSDPVFSIPAVLAAANALLAHVFEASTKNKPQPSKILYVLDPVIDDPRVTALGLRYEKAPVEKPE